MVNPSLLSSLSQVASELLPIVYPLITRWNQFSAHWSQLSYAHRHAKIPYITFLVSQLSSPKTAWRSPTTLFLSQIAIFRVDIPVVILCLHLLCLSLKLLIFSVKSSGPSKITLSHPRVLNPKWWVSSHSPVNQVLLILYSNESTVSFCSWLIWAATKSD